MTLVSVPTLKFAGDTSPVDAILADIERELMATMPALLVLPRIGPAELRRWVRGAFETLTADAIASAQRDLAALAELDAREIRRELEG